MWCPGGTGTAASSATGSAALLGPRRRHPGPAAVPAARADPPLYANPFSGNTASVRLLERCGFERSGTVRYGQAEHIMLVLGDT